MKVRTAAGGGRCRGGQRSTDMAKVASVIGATGYVGSHVVNHLLGLGYAVRCSTRRLAAVEPHGKQHPPGVPAGRLASD